MMRAMMLNHELTDALACLAGLFLPRWPPSLVSRSAPEESRAESCRSTVLIHSVSPRSRRPKRGAGGHAPVDRSDAARMRADAAVTWAASGACSALRRQRRRDAASF